MRARVVSDFRANRCSLTRKRSASLFLSSKVLYMMDSSDSDIMNKFVCVDNVDIEAILVSEENDKELRQSKIWHFWLPSSSMTRAVMYTNSATACL